MSEMTLERFLTLIDAYGADPRRWPEGEREAARAFANGHPDQVADAVTEAATLDAALWRSPTPYPSTALRERLIAAAGPVARGGRRWLDRLALVAGAGWATAACAGVAAGIVLGGQLTADHQADAVLYEAYMLSADDAEISG